MICRPQSHRTIVKWADGRKKDGTKAVASLPGEGWDQIPRAARKSHEMDPGGGRIPILGDTGRPRPPDPEHPTGKPAPKCQMNSGQGGQGRYAKSYEEKLLQTD